MKLAGFSTCNDVKNHCTKATSAVSLSLLLSFLSPWATEAYLVDGHWSGCIAGDRVYGGNLLGSCFTGTGNPSNRIGNSEAAAIQRASGFTIQTRPRCLGCKAGNTYFVFTRDLTDYPNTEAQINKKKKWECPFQNYFITSFTWPGLWLLSNDMI